MWFSKIYHYPTCIGHYGTFYNKFACPLLSSKVKVTVKARGLCYNKSSPGKTTEPIDIKLIEDEYKMNDL